MSYGRLKYYVRAYLEAKAADIPAVMTDVENWAKMNLSEIEMESFYAEIQGDYSEILTEQAEENEA